jgi:hypothetical protein
MALDSPEAGFSLAHQQIGKFSIDERRLEDRQKSSSSNLPSYSSTFAHSSKISVD